MTFDELTPENQDTVRGMVDYCINHGIGLGMDEGRDPQTCDPYPSTAELQRFADGRALGHRLVDQVLLEEGNLDSILNALTINIQFLAARHSDRSHLVESSHRLIAWLRNR